MSSVSLNRSLSVVKCRHEGGRSGSWSTQSLTYVDAAPCSHDESGSRTNTVFKTDDDRN
jgi:hypothetical protein